MLFDTHCHLINDRYELTPDELIEDSLQNGVGKLVAVGTSITDSTKTLENISSSSVYGSIGVYPHEDANLTISQIYQELDKLYKNQKSKIVAVGECGIDIGDLEKIRSIEDQCELFKMQIGFAIEHDLPIIMHNRNGDNYIKDIFEKYVYFKNKKLKGVAHCFVGSWNLAQYLLDFGFYISFSGIITFSNVSQSLLEVVQKVPINKIVIETDSPDLAPQGHRGKTNYPKYVKIVAEKVAQVRNSTLESIIDATYKNSCNLFGINND